MSEKRTITCKQCGQQHTFEADNVGELSSVIADEHGWKDWSPRHDRAICADCMGKLADDELGSVGYENLFRKAGFAQISHCVTYDSDVSDGAFRCYALLVKYAQQKPNCWVGVERAAQNLRRSKRTISRYLDELEERGLIRRQRRYGTSTKTWLRDLERVKGYKELAEQILEERANNGNEAEEEPEQPLPF